MPKLIEFNIDDWYLDIFFKPIRKKNELIVVMFEAIKLMRICKSLHIVSGSSKIVLMVLKMSRLAFVSENKHFSIALPFSIQETDEGVLCFSKNIGEIDSVIISDILSIFSEDSTIHDTCISSLADLVIDKGELRPGYWDFIKEILLLESGYLRYDYDAEHENGYIHPLNHVDVFYSSNATFKVGLDNKIDEKELFDIIDLKTDCYYLSGR